MQKILKTKFGMVIATVVFLFVLFLNVQGASQTPTLHTKIASADGKMCFWYKLICGSTGEAYYSCLVVGTGLACLCGTISGDCP